MVAVPDIANVRSALEAVSSSQGFNAWLDFQIMAVESGSVTIEAGLREDMKQHHGSSHGGVLGALADTAASWAAATVAGDVRTAYYTVHFLRQASGARLRAVGTVLKPGRRQVTVEVKVYAGDTGNWGEPVVIALASIAPVAS